MLGNPLLEMPSLSWSHLKKIILANPKKMEKITISNNFNGDYKIVRSNNQITTT
jgi:hypothetical protein